jgi:deoxycytidylate deaminase
MTNVSIKNKLSGLVPIDSWTNSKGHISALVKGGKVMVYAECTLGGNSYYCSKRGRSCHSEISALKHGKMQQKSRRQISKYTMWNIRWDKNGNIVDSQPCFHCHQVLMNLGIKTIIFSTKDGKFIKNKIRDMTCTLSSGFRY